MSASKLAIVGLSLLTLAAVPACSDDYLDFPVDGSKTLGSLDEGELAAICQEVSRMWSFFSKDEVCLMYSLAMRDLLGKGDPHYCSAKHAECMAAPVDPWSMEQDCDLEPSEALSKCQVTVQQLETCYNDRLRTARSILPGLSCTSPREAYTNVNDPPSCQAIAGMCPGVDLD
jgi:hypothetical protein